MGVTNRVWGTDNIFTNIAAIFPAIDKSYLWARRNKARWKLQLCHYNIIQYNTNKHNIVTSHDMGMLSHFVVCAVLLLMSVFTYSDEGVLITSCSLLVTVWLCLMLVLALQNTTASRWVPGQLLAGCRGYFSLSYLEDCPGPLLDWPLSSLLESFPFYRGHSNICPFLLKE